MKHHIKNGHLIDPHNQIDAKKDLFIAAGKIVGVGRPPADFQANKVIDATGLVVAPGLIDLCARLREPGYEHKATLASEMTAAIAGGVTSLVCPPDTDPVLDEPGLVEMLKFRARSLNQAHVYPLGALTIALKGHTLTEMAQLTQAGCIGFSQADIPIADTQVLLRAMQYATTLGYTIWLRPQDAWLGRNGIAASGPIATRMGLPGIPIITETIALHIIFELMRSTGARIHVCRLSSAAGIHLIKQAKEEGLKISCDVGIHHVHLSDTDLGYFDPQMRMAPPLRSQRDRDAIRTGLADGTIDAICSDHTPVDDDEKLLPFAQASVGATGLELLLPLTLKWAYEQQQSLSLALSKVTATPAAILGLLNNKQAGQLAIGSTADICLFDPKEHWVLNAHTLRSQGKNSPFLGRDLQGVVKKTLVGGHIAYESN
ncbi:MAG: dihydroorotase [Ottowia sp.]|nr:dihydroorotase [Ottowia sp.]